MKSIILLVFIGFCCCDGFSQCGGTLVTVPGDNMMAFCMGSGGSCTTSSTETLTPSVPAGNTITFDLTSSVTGPLGVCATVTATLETVPGGIIVFNSSSACGSAGGCGSTTFSITVPSLTTALKLTVNGTSCAPASGGTSQATVNFTTICSEPPNPCAPCVLAGSGSTWTWTGCKTTDWFDGCNWDRQSVPTTTSDVIIPNTTNKPLITAGTADCNTIEIQSSTGARLDLNSSGGGIINIAQ
ncbi:hypothetical protein JYU20_04045 [Bacteroidales bacterium AH-315-I05]|nr:hypothetical protein [Bacteroidales bacterium AH-315-I05]